MKRSKPVANVSAWGEWAACLAAGCLLACEEAPECSPPRGVDSQPLVRGRIDVNVSGAEAAPVDFVLAARSTGREGVTLSGCGQSGDVPWYVDLGVSCAKAH